MANKKIYSTIFELGGKLNSSFSRAFKQAKKGTDQAESGLRGVQKEAKETAGAFGKLSKVTGDFGKALYKVSQYTGAFALVSGVTDTFTDMVGSVGDYQSELKQVQAATGATKEEMREMSDILRNLYTQNLGESWTDLSEALTIARQVTHQQGKELEDTTKNALIYRDVFKGDFAESLKTVDTMVKNFGITSSQAFNLLAQGAQKGLDKSGELLDSANEYAPYFKTLGFTADQMFNTFSAGLESGAFNLDKVGDAVKEFGIRVKDDSKSTNEAFTALGLNASKMAQTFARGGPEAQAAFKQVVKAISSVKDPVKKNVIGVQLFGTMFEDLEKDVIAAMGNARDQFDMTKNTMQEVADIKYDTIGAAFQGIGRQIMTELILPIGDKALPVLQRFGKWIQVAIPQAKKFMGQLWGEVSKLAEIFAPLKGEATNAFKVISPYLISFADSTKKIFTQVGPAIVKTASAVWQAGTRMAKAIMPFGVYLQQKLGPVISKVFGFIANDAVPAVSRAFTAMLPSIISVATKFGATISALSNVVKPIINALVGAFNFAFPAIKAVVLATIHSVTGVFNGLMTTLGGVLDFITGVFTGNWGKAWEGVRDIFSGVFSALGSILKAPINAVIGLINQAFEKIGSISIDIPDWVPGLGGKTFGIDLPQIPMLKEGGVTTGPTLAMIGEGAEQEAVLPLSKLESLLDSRGATGSHGGGGGGGDIYIDFSPQYNVSGGADVQKEVAQASEMSLQKLEQMLKKLQAKQQRVRFQ